MVSAATYLRQLNFFLLDGRNGDIRESLHKFWAFHWSEVVVHAPSARLIDGPAGPCATSLSGSFVEIHVWHPERWGGDASQEQERVLEHNHQRSIGSRIKEKIKCKHGAVLLNKPVCDALPGRGCEEIEGVFFVGLRLMSGLGEFGPFATGIGREHICSFCLKPLRNIFCLAKNLRPSMGMKTPSTGKTYIPGSSKESLVQERDAIDECPDIWKLVFYLQALKSKLAGNLTREKIEITPGSVFTIMYTYSKHELNSAAKTAYTGCPQNTWQFFSAKKILKNDYKFQWFSDSLCATGRYFHLYIEAKTLHTPPQDESAKMSEILAFSVL